MDSILDHLNLSEYRSVFKENGVDENSLFLLSEYDVKELVPAIGKRAILLNYIREQRGQNNQVGRNYSNQQPQVVSQNMIVPPPSSQQRLVPPQRVSSGQVELKSIQTPVSGDGGGSGQIFETRKFEFSKGCGFFVTRAVYITEVNQQGTKYQERGIEMYDAKCPPEAISRWVLLGVLMSMMGVLFLLMFLIFLGSSIAFSAVSVSALADSSEASRGLGIAADICWVVTFLLMLPLITISCCSFPFSIFTEGITQLYTNELYFEYGTRTLHLSARTMCGTVLEEKIPFSSISDFKYSTGIGIMQYVKIILFALMMVCFLIVGTWMFLVFALTYGITILLDLIALRPRKFFVSRTDGKKNNFCVLMVRTETDRIAADQLMDCLKMSLRGNSGGK